MLNRFSVEAVISPETVAILSCLGVPAVVPYRV